MANATVRAATPADAEPIAQLQYSLWQTAYASLLPATALNSLHKGELVSQWLETITHGPAQVWLASEGEWQVGICAAGLAPPSEVASATGAIPDDAEQVALVSVLLVEPRWQRRGHGGRLLATGAAALREIGAQRGIIWLLENDMKSQSFFQSIGWQRDGVVRTLDTGGQPIREIRFTGSLELSLTS